MTHMMRHFSCVQAPLTPADISAPCSALAVKEIRLTDDKRLLPRVSLPIETPDQESLVSSVPNDAYRAHNIELRICPATDEQRWQVSSTCCRGVPIARI